MFRFRSVGAYGLLTMMTLGSPVIMGCGGNLEEDVVNQQVEENQETENANQEEGSLLTVVEEEGYTEVTVDATDQEAIRYVNIVDGEVVEAGGGWHLGFRRQQITLNGGVSGEGDVAAKILDGEDFDALGQAPDGVYLTDVEGEFDERGQNPGLVFQRDDGWYAYDGTTHTLSARDRVYVLYLGDDQFIKVQMLDYYDEAGTSGYVKFRWASVDAPEGAIEIDDEGPSEEEGGYGTTSITVDASDDATWVGIDLVNGEVVGSTEEAVRWDVAIQRTKFRTNSGTSGDGSVGVYVLEGADFDAIGEADPEWDFAEDEDVPLQGPGGGTYSGNPVLTDWFDYDFETHQVSPADKVFVIALGDGGYAKLVIESYADGVFEIRIASTGPEGVTFAP